MINAAVCWRPAEGAAHPVRRDRRRSDRRGATGLALLAVLACAALAGPYLTAWHWAEADFTAFGEPPSSRHWLGTTPGGKDVCALTLRGLRRSLETGLLVAAAATGLAAVAGVVAGYSGGWADRVLTGGTDLLLALPAFLVLAVVSPSLRGRTWLFAVLLAALTWMVTARAVRVQTRTLRSRGHVLAARLMGASSWRILSRHIAPNLASLLIADATLNVSAAILAESGLSYLGLGIQPPDNSLGTLLADGSQSATVYPWLFLPAAVLLFLLVLGVNLAGDALRDALADQR